MSPRGPIEVLNIRLNANGGLMSLPVSGALHPYFCVCR